MTLNRRLLGGSLSRCILSLFVLSCFSHFSFCSYFCHLILLCSTLAWVFKVSLCFFSELVLSCLFSCVRITRFIKGRPLTWALFRPSTGRAYPCLSYWFSLVLVFETFQVKHGVSTRVLGGLAWLLCDLHDRVLPFKTLGNSSEIISGRDMPWARSCMPLFHISLHWCPWYAHAMWVLSRDRSLPPFHFKTEPPVVSFHSISHKFIFFSSCIYILTSFISFFPKLCSIWLPLFTYSTSILVSYH